MGKEAIQHATSYALEAERKMGEMLKQTERAKGTRLGGNVVLPPDGTPTLSDLGLTKRESAEAQMLASIPQDESLSSRAGKRIKKSIGTNVPNEDSESFPVVDVEQTPLGEEVYRP